MGDRVAALKFFAEAMTTGRDPNPDVQQMAYAKLLSSVEVDPTFAEGWFQIAVSATAANKTHAAVAAYRRYLELPDGEANGDPTPKQRAVALCNMGQQLYVLGDLRKALLAIEGSLRLDADLGYAWSNFAMIEQAYGNTKASVAWAERGHNEHKDVTTRMALAFAHLFNGDFAKGLELFEARFEYKLKHFLSYPYPQWKGEADKNVFLVSDQGIGDALSFARFIPLAASRADFLTIMVNKPLVRLFEAMFAGIKNKRIVPAPGPFPVADFWSAIMSIPTALGLNDDEIANQPHTPVPPFHIAPHWKSPDRKLHVGIAWAGAEANDINHWRSVPLQEFVTLIDVPGIQLYSLQADHRSRDVHDMALAPAIKDLTPYINDVADTVAILQHLDAVVTIESAMGHIAGFCGKKTLMPYSFHGRDWRIGVQGDKPLWYPGHEVFKQGLDEPWKAVFARIKAKLIEMAGVA
jgi:tetratricopeptide (TPR) repeat protein